MSGSMSSADRYSFRPVERPAPIRGKREARQLLRRPRRRRGLRLETLEDRMLLSAVALSSHPWNPQPAKAALMVVAAHPDDEVLFFGGTIPYYSTVAKVPLVHISMTCGWTDGGDWVNRMNELMDAGWAYGLRNPPIVPMGPEHPLFADVYTDGADGRDATFDVWNNGEFDDFGDVAAGRSKAASYLATQIRTYRPDVIVTHDFDGEYGHGNHRATAFATADAFTLAADPTYVDGNAPWQAQKLYSHLLDRTPSQPMLSKLWMDWSVPYAELGGKTPLQVADEGLAAYVSEGGSALASIWADWRYSERYGLYASTVGPDTVSADGWAHTGFFEHVGTTNDAPVRTAGTLAPIAVAEDSANLLTKALGLSGLAYSPGGAEESGQTLTYTITAIPSFVQIYKANGVTRVNVNGTVTLTELRGLRYKTVADANGGGNLVWTVRDNGTPSQMLTESLPIAVTPVNDAPVLNAAKSPAFNAQSRNAGAPAGPVGTLVSRLVDFASPAGQLDNVSEADAAAQLGIAVVAANASLGKWHFSTNNGATWTLLGSVSTSSARLLAADANTRLYFQPIANYSGTISSALTFRAWDRTSGAGGGVASTLSRGGTTAFSSLSDTASLAISTATAAATAKTASRPAATFSARDAAVLSVVGQVDAEKAGQTSLDSPSRKQPAAALLWQAR